MMRSRLNRTGPIANREVYEKIRALRIGNRLAVPRSAWIGKTPLGHTLNNNPNYRGRFSVCTSDDKSGWVIVRLK
jgi:hypothetical protein